MFKICFAAQSAWQITSVAFNAERLCSCKGVNPKRGHLHALGARRRAASLAHGPGGSTPAGAAVFFKSSRQLMLVGRD
jgi:hypothetical protein